MTIEYEIIDEKNYTPNEKNLCDYLTKVCEVKIYLGHGPTSWCDGDKRIILDKKEATEALSCSTSGRFDLALSLLCEKLSHLLAHLKTSNEHTTEFYKEQSSILCKMLSNFIKSVRYTENHIISKPRKIKLLEKVVWVKKSKYFELIITSIKDLVESINKINDNELMIIAKNMDWTDYLKLTRELKYWEKNFPGDIIIKRGKRHIQKNKLS